LKTQKVFYRWKSRAIFRPSISFITATKKKPLVMLEFIFTIQGGVFLEGGAKLSEI